MKSFKQFLMEEDNMRKDAIDSDTTYAGMHMRQPTPEEDTLFKERRDVSGFYGSGTAYETGHEGEIVINPYGTNVQTPLQKEGLKRIEAVRGVYSISPDTLNMAPDLTPEQDKNFEFYTKDAKNEEGKDFTDEQKKNIRKSTFYSRVAVGDDLNPMKVGKGEQPSLSDEQNEHAAELDRILSDKGWYGKIKGQRYETNSKMGDIA